MQQQTNNKKNTQKAWNNDILIKGRMLVKINLSIIK